MNLLNNGFSRFLLSGFGTDTAAGKALGISIFLVLFVFIVAVYVIIGIVKICEARRYQTSRMVLTL